MLKRLICLIVGHKPDEHFRAKPGENPEPYSMTVDYTWAYRMFVCERCGTMYCGKAKRRGADGRASPRAD